MYKAFSKDDLERMTIQELVETRDRLMRQIRKYEKSDEYLNPCSFMLPSPDTIYRCDLEAVGRVCNEISKRHGNGERVINLKPLLPFEEEMSK